MIYIAVFILFIIIVLLIYVYRLIRAYVQRATASRRRNDPEAASANQTAQVVHDIPSLSGVASDITRRLFVNPRPATEEEYVPYHRRNLDRPSMGVERAEDDADPELPTYLETTALPSPPPASYQSPDMIRHEHAAQANMPVDAPPKYFTSPVVSSL